MLHYIVAEIEPGAIQQSVFSLVAVFNSMVALKDKIHTKAKAPPLRKRSPNPKNVTICKTHTKVKIQPLTKMHFRSSASVRPAETANVQFSL